MPYLYFGFRPRNRGATKLAVKTDMGDMEPAEPSRIKVFTQVAFSPIWSILTGLLGLAVAVLSFPTYSYVPDSTKGLMTNPASEPLPLKLPGLAVVMKKGAVLSVENVGKLEEAGFSSMQFSGRTVWLKEEGSRDDFTMVDVMEGVDPLGPCPSLYLNTHSFRAFLVLRSFTTRICELFHYLCETHSVQKFSSQRQSSVPDKEDWKDATTLSGSEDAVMATSVPTFTFKKSASYVLNGCEKTVGSIVLHAGSAQTPISHENSGVVVNPLTRPFRGFVRPGSLSSIKAPGRIFKFNPQLALPDPNLIGDVIGRYFLAGLGDSYDDQLENLELLKTGVAGLRLTRVGEELTHLYKCIEIAIQSSTGCVPIFSRTNYEGCILMGGFSDRSFIIHGEAYPALCITDLKNDMLLVSDHASSLQYISTLFPEGDLRKSVQECESMYELRKHCLELVVTQDVRDEIIRKASLLDFGRDSWVINPNSLSSCMRLISTFSDLDYTYPIGRMSLFSKDPVLVALSCFGEKTAPSWDIPNGTQCSLSKANPPAPPAPNMKNRAASKGEISDATWVMVIRRTDLFSAVDEFKQMASTLKYRSSSSALAKRVGHRVFSRERMAEFWGPMREALRVVNPLAAFEKDEGTLKRGATDSSATERGESENVKKRRMDF